ncbi:MAG TPA: DUF6799 domain-containing protein [Myxococcota bacterium]|nr:DUF6799 domain-containing protein [Myxococcota bacterium]
MSQHRFTIFGAALIAAICLTASPVIAASTDGVMMKDNKMMMMQDGKATGPMSHDMTMTNGTKVMMDGTMVMKDGTKDHMKDGQMMTMDGKMMEGGKASGMEK